MATRGNQRLRSTAAVSTQRPDRRLILKYALVQVPGIVLAAAVALALQRLLGVPPWAAAAGVCLWIAKDVVMFFFTWRAYAGGSGDGADAMIGLEGEVVEDLSPTGRVFVRGEVWQARLADPERRRAGATTAIRVVAVEGLRLVVSPLEEKGR